MRRVLTVLGVALLVWVVLRSAAPGNRVSGSDASVQVGPTNADPMPVPAPRAAPSAAQPSTDAPGKGLGGAHGKAFRSRDRLDEHFAKHGGEFGGISESEYLRMAQSLRDAPVGGDVLEIVRPDDGVVSRFDKRSGAFLAFDRDGTIRTFFKPNDGERYFRRQATRPPSP